MRPETGQFREGLIFPELKDYARGGKYQKNLFEFAHDENSPDYKELKNHVEQYNGTVRIMVHPFFERNNNDEQWVKYFAEAKRVEKGLKTLIEKGSDNKTPPLLIFEEQKGLEDTQRYLRPLTDKYRSNTYYVPTEEADPVPKFTEPDTLHHEDEEMEKAQWDRIAEIFKKLGVREAIVGGLILQVIFKDNETYAHMWEEGDDDPYKLSMCVGTTIAQLQARGINIQVSNFFSDHSAISRRELAKMKNIRSKNYPLAT